MGWLGKLVGLEVGDVVFAWYAGCERSDEALVTELTSEGKRPCPVLI